MISGDYEGDLREGVREGTGKITWSNGDTYSGEFKNGLRYVCVYASTCMYEYVCVCAD
jgi:hypothetical protein